MQWNQHNALGTITTEYSELGFDFLYEIRIKIDLVPKNSALESAFNKKRRILVTIWFECGPRYPGFNLSGSSSFI